MLWKIVGVFYFGYIEYMSGSNDSAMPQTTIAVRLNETLSDFAAANVGERGAYENVSEYMRDLIRLDKERVEREAFERLKAELAQAYAAPESACKPLTAADVIARNRS